MPNEKPVGHCFLALKYANEMYSKSDESRCLFAVERIEILDCPADKALDVRHKTFAEFCQ